MTGTDLKFNRAIRCTLLATFLAGLLPAATAVSQESANVKEETGSSSKAETKPDSGTGNGEESASTSTSADPGFIPSEEISEDLSVPFPVDI